MVEQLIGLVPAAGKGVRLGLPYPKELYPIIRENRYKPLAQFTLDQLTTAGLQHVIFVINQSKHQLVGYFGNGQRFGCNLSYVVQEVQSQQEHSTSPGLAHALDSAYHLTQGKTVFFGMPDTIMQPDHVFDTVYKAATPADDVLLALFRTKRPEKFGMVRQGENGRVLEIMDKPRQTDLIYMWGCIIWRPRFTEHLHQCVQEGIGDFAHIMNLAITTGLQFSSICFADGSFIDLGTYDEIMALDHGARDKMALTYTTLAHR